MPASEQGVNRERYMLVPRTLIFLTRGDRVLLLKGASDKHLWAGLYNGIGGHIEQGEDITSAALRELREEIGVAAVNIYFCGTVTVDTETNPGVCVFVYKGEIMSDTPLASKEGTLEWFTLSDLSKLPLVSDLPVLLPKILAMRQGDQPFSAHSRYNETGKLVLTFYQ